LLKDLVDRLLKDLVDRLLLSDIHQELADNTWSFSARRSQK